VRPSASEARVVHGTPRPMIYDPQSGESFRQILDFGGFMARPVKF
jgi:hypothetical protein